MATPSTSDQQAVLLNKITQSGAKTFRNAVSYILTEWPSLSLAIDNGMGGHEARNKREWMIDHISDVMLKGKDIELVDYLGELINQEFDTLIEDGSLEYNCHWIEKFYKDCLQGKDQEVMLSINQAATKKQSLSNVKIPAPIDVTQESSDDESDDDELNDRNPNV